MSILYVNLKLNDDDSTDKIDNLSVTYNRRFVFDRIIKTTDGAISIDLSSVGEMVALYVHTDNSITLNNGEDIVIDSDFFTLAAFDSSFTLTAGSSDAEVSIRAYGVVS